MGDSAEQYVVAVISGARRGVMPAALRLLLRAAEPFYIAAVNWRNRRFDRGRNVKRLPRVVISIGNITAGGTGKTPLVQWLCEKLLEKGKHPAVLMRGYKSSGGLSDEQRMLQRALHVPVQANPDRFEGGAQVLARHSEVDTFILDDGFQHRRLARDFDLVLIDARQPFGFDHVHPRGLLREPLSNLSRASAILITRSDEVDAAALAVIESRIRQFASPPIYYAMHRQVGFRSRSNDFVPIDALAGKRLFAFCAIGNPQSFIDQLKRHCPTVVGSRIYRDHHAYSATDLKALAAEADRAGAEAIVTTEKDWAKVELIAGGSALRIWRTQLAIEFKHGDEDRLLAHVSSTEKSS